MKFPFHQIAVGICSAGLLCSQAINAEELSAGEVNETRLAGETVLQAYDCGYGRGKLAIDAAKARVTELMLQYLQGSSQFSDNTQQDSLQDDGTSARFSSEQRQDLLETLGRGTALISFGSPTLSGNDTCIAGTLAAAEAKPSGGALDDIAWEGDMPESKTVTVIGEGWPKPSQQLTARQAAELDAFQRAVQQVLGVMLSSAYMEQSLSNMQVSDEGENNNFKDVASRQLTARSSGFVSEWAELANKPLSDKGLQVTLQVTVSTGTLAQQVKQLSDRLGRPTLYVDSDVPALADEFKSLLSQWQLPTSNNRFDASLVLKLTAKPLKRSNGAQLDLRLGIEDPWGNRYGNWHNDPSLLALDANTPDLIEQLAEVHLSVDGAREEIRQSLTDAMLSVAERGGPLREIAVDRSLLEGVQQFQMLLEGIAGASEIDVRADNKRLIGNLRYPGTAGDLASVLEPAVGMFGSRAVKATQIPNDYKIILK